MVFLRIHCIQYIVFYRNGQPLKTFVVLAAAPMRHLFPIPHFPITQKQAEQPFAELAPKVCPAAMFCDTAHSRSSLCHLGIRNPDPNH